MAEETKEVPARCTEITPATAPGEAEHADVAEWSGKKHDFCKEIEGIPRFLIEELKKNSRTALCGHLRRPGRCPQNQSIR